MSSPTQAPLEPPEVEPCDFCDGEGKVLVARIAGADGTEAPWPLDDGEGPEVNCPFCTGRN